MNNRKNKKKVAKSGKKHKNMKSISQDPEDPENLTSPHQIKMGWRRFKVLPLSILFKPLMGLDCLVSGWFWLQLTFYRFVTRKQYPLFLNGNSVVNYQNTGLTRENESLKKENTGLEDVIQQRDSEIEELRYQLTEEKNATEKGRADVRNLNVCLQELSKKIEDMKESNRRLKEEKTSVEKEKEDALRRLSELVSVRLRDNNPNIVDLNDPCRPTKLAEMYSELYDNEWTSAYAVLEGRFTETQAIVILLDTVMEAYEFCEERMIERWNSLEKWFLDSGYRFHSLKKVKYAYQESPHSENTASPRSEKEERERERKTFDLPGAQQTCKWLKDSRKASILKKLEEIDADFEELIHKMCKDKEIGKLLSDDTVKRYITKCVELCLLMVTTDPPVILGCPNWAPSTKLPATDGDEDYKDENEKQDEGVADEKHPDGDAAHKENKNDTTHDNASFTLTVIDEKQKVCESKNEEMATETQKHVTDNNEVVKNGCQSGTNEADNSIQVDIPDVANGVANETAKEPLAQTVGTESCITNGTVIEPAKEPLAQTAGTESGIANGTANENANKPVEQKGLVAVIPIQRSLFEKETFKEYTTRGKYLDFIVWPALYLHKNGPLLAKGIAQGSKEEFNRNGTTSWIWRRKLPSDVE